MRGWPDVNNPAAWIVAAILLIMPLIANGFFLIEIFATTLILGTIALSLMFLAGYGGMVSLMQLTIAGFAAYMVAVFGVSGNANISLGWPWWLAVPMALTLATIFGTLGGALAVRTEGIYTIMITLAIGAAFYYFTNQNWAIFNGHTGINNVVDAAFLGRRLALGYSLLLCRARGRRDLLLRRRLHLARAVRPGAAGRARQSAPHGRARLQRQCAPRRGLCGRVLHRRPRRRAAGLELPPDLAGLGQRRRLHRHSHHRRRRRHHPADRSLSSARSSSSSCAPSRSTSWSRSGSTATASGC